VHFIIQIHKSAILESHTCWSLRHDSFLTIICNFTLSWASAFPIYIFVFWYTNFQNLYWCCINCRS